MNYRINNTICVILVLILAQQLSKCLAQELKRPSTVMATDLADIPAELAGLAERGKVEFEFYVRQKLEFPGETHFQFRTKHNFRLAYNVSLARGKRVADVSIRVDHIELESDSKIFLPMRLRDDGFWTNRLVVHEFEHVRLNSDSRPKQLADFLLRRMGRARVQLTAQPADDSRIIDEFYAARAESIRKEVVRIMQANNDYLDELTLHGEKLLEDEEGFFESLYTKENLTKYKFAYLNEVDGLLRKRSYREIE